MHDLITIIVPTYNTESFIKRSIGSLQKQTYSKIEILVIDDCSTDKTLEICKHLQNDDDRIKIISKNKRKGVANSRNIGICNAKGKYIMFMDSDDYVDKNFCMKMISVAKKYNADMAFCDFISIDQGIKKYTKLIRGNEGIVKHEAAMRTLITASFLWNKIFSKKMFDRVVFPEGVTYEDIRILYRLVDKANVIAYKPAYLYFYEQRENSIVHTNALNNRTYYFKAIVQLADFFKLRYPSLFYEECVYLMPTAFEYCMNNDKGDFLYKTALEILKNNSIPKEISTKEKIKIMLVKISPSCIDILKTIKNGRIYKWIKKDH